jgi:hypothetical protein
MKTFDVCSGCSNHHNWREIDYDNILYVSMENAICLTLCPACTNKFLTTPQNRSSLIRYKQKINGALQAKSKSILEFKRQNSATSFFGLSF